MDSVGARFSKEHYIKVDYDFATNTGEVTVITEILGEPVINTGNIVFDEG